MDGVGLAGIQISRYWKNVVEESGDLDRSIGVPTRRPQWALVTMVRNERMKGISVSSLYLYFLSCFFLPPRRIVAPRVTYEMKFNAFLEFITWAARDSRRNIFSKPGGIFVSFLYAPCLWFAPFEILTSRLFLRSRHPNQFAFVNWIFFSPKGIAFISLNRRFKRRDRIIGSK